MNIWKTLNILETKDKNIIKDAYRNLLSSVNPEDSPEDFMKLRSAYEEALSFANKKDDIEDIDNNDPIEIWMNKVKDAYSHFSKRIDKEVWAEILNDDACLNLDTSNKALESLLVFLMDNYYLPQEIFILFDECFNLVDSKEELYELFPKAFIDNAIISSIQIKDYLDFSLFKIDDSIDYDEFFSTFYKLQREINNHNTVEATKLLNDLSEFLDIQPFVDVERIKLYIDTSKIDEAVQLSIDLYNKYSNWEPVIYMRAETEYALEHYTEAIVYYKELLKLNPTHYSAKAGLADCYLKQESYKEAKDIYIELIKLTPYNNSLLYSLDLVNEALIKQYNITISKNPNDIDAIFELAWCYLQIGSYSLGLSLMQDVTPNEYNVLDYYNLLGRFYLCTDSFNESLACFVKLEKSILNASKEVLSNKINKNYSVSLAIYRQASAYMSINDFDNALLQSERSLLEDKSNSSSLELKAVALFNLKRYEETIDICEQLIELDSYKFSGYFYLAKSYFELSYFMDSLDNYNICINLNPSDLSSYLEKINLSTILSKYDEAQETIDFVEKSNVKSNLFQFYRAKLLQATGNAEAAFKNYNYIIVNEKETPTDMNNLEDVYYQIALIEYNTHEDTNASMDAVDLAIKENDEHIPSIHLKAFLLEKLNKPREAILYYERTLSLNPRHYLANGEIGEIYSQKNEYDKAIYYFTKQLENDPSVYYYISRGLLYLKLDRFAEARADFFSAIEDDPDDSNSYNDLGVSYQYEDELDTAIDYYKKSIETLSINKENFSEKVYRNMATCYMRKKNYDKAIDCYNKNIELFNLRNDYYQKALIFLNASRFIEARTAFKKWIISCGCTEEDSDYLYLIGDCYYHDGDLKKAFTFYNAAIHNDIQNTDALNALASAYQYNGNYKKAIKYYKIKLKTKSDSIPTYFCIAECYFQLGNIKKATIYGNKGLNLAFNLNDKSFDKLAQRNYYIGSLYLSMAKYKEALEYLEKAISCRKCNSCDFCKCCEAYFSLGKLYEATNNYDKALSYYMEAHNADPHDINYTMAVKRIQSISNK